MTDHELRNFIDALLEEVYSYDNAHRAAYLKLEDQLIAALAALDEQTLDTTTAPHLKCDGTVEWRDDAGDLHRLDGPAVVYASGHAEFWLHGIEMPERHYDALLDLPDAVRERALYLITFSGRTVDAAIEAALRTESVHDFYADRRPDAEAAFDQALSRLRRRAEAANPLTGNEAAQTVRDELDAGRRVFGHTTLDDPYTLQLHFASDIDELYPLRARLTIDETADIPVDLVLDTLNFNMTCYELRYS